MWYLVIQFQLQNKYEHEEFCKEKKIGDILSEILVNSSSKGSYLGEKLSSTLFHVLIKCYDFNDVDFLNVETPFIVYYNLCNFSDLSAL